MSYARDAARGYLVTTVPLVKRLSHLIAQQDTGSRGGGIRTRDLLLPKQAR